MAEKVNKWGEPLLSAGMIALLLGLFTWLAGSNLIESSVFLAIGAVYAFLVVRVVSRSFRAYTALVWTFQLNFWTLMSFEAEDVLDIPSASPWFIGFLVGAIAGQFLWPRAFPVRPRRRGKDGTFSGGLSLALINLACAGVLLGMGVTQWILLSPSTGSFFVLTIAVIAGWALFRFPPPLPIRNALILLGIPVVFIALAFAGGAIGQLAFAYSWGYGVLAGILIGGRYWSGDRLGEPRPPFSGSRQRQRRKRRSRSKSMQAQEDQNPVAAATQDQSVAAQGQVR